MLGNKSSVSALHEYCAKRQIPTPTFQYVKGDDGFECVVELDGIMAHATGRSKRDAKHLASVNIIAKLRALNPEDVIAALPIDAIDIEMNVPNTDMVGALRDYCLQHDHPMPVFDLVQQAGTPDGPEFTILCSVASIKRYGVSDKKKDARQKAAYDVLQVIREDTHLENQSQVATLDAKTTQIEEERFFKFKTYRDMTNSKTGVVPGVLLCDRHNYFTKFYDTLKMEAIKIITDSNYVSEKSKALDLLRALKITPTISPLTNLKSIEPIVLIDLNCEYDVVFAGSENVVYRSIVEYFRNMLY